MRTRLVLSVVVGALFVPLVFASPAGAQEETVGRCISELLEVTGLETAEEIMTAGLADGASDEAVEELFAPVSGEDGRFGRRHAPQYLEEHGGLAELTVNEEPHRSPSRPCRRGRRLARDSPPGR